MLKLKTVLRNMFIYTEPMKEHGFILPESLGVKQELQQKEKFQQSDIEGIPPLKNIYNNIDKNLDFIKVKYNSLINSDIILREFTITAKHKKYRALLIAIDGMVSSELINNYLLKPLMIENSTANRSERLALLCKNIKKWFLKIFKNLICVIIYIIS